MCRVDNAVHHVEADPSVRCDIGRDVDAQCSNARVSGCVESRTGQRRVRRAAVARCLDAKRCRAAQRVVVGQRQRRSLGATQVGLAVQVVAVVMDRRLQLVAGHCEPATRSAAAIGVILDPVARPVQAAVVVAVGDDAERVEQVACRPQRIGCAARHAAGLVPGPEGDAARDCAVPVGVRYEAHIGRGVGRQQPRCRSAGRAEIDPQAAAVERVLPGAVRVVDRGDRNSGLRGRVHVARHAGDQDRDQRAGVGGRVLVDRGEVVSTGQRRRGVRGRHDDRRIGRRRAEGCGAAARGDVGRAAGHAAGPVPGLVSQTVDDGATPVGRGHKAHVGGQVCGEQPRSGGARCAEVVPGQATVGRVLPRAVAVVDRGDGYALQGAAVHVGHMAGDQVGDQRARVAHRVAVDRADVVSAQEHRRIVNRIDGNGRGGDVRVRVAVVNQVGERIRPREIRVRRVGKRAVGVESQGPVRRTRNECRLERIAVRGRVVTQHTGIRRRALCDAVRDERARHRKVIRADPCGAAAGRGNSGFVDQAGVIGARAIVFAAQRRVGRIASAGRTREAEAIGRGCLGDTVYIDGDRIRGVIDHSDYI